jgi:8-oxo-dGTP diphosphatase
VRRIRVVAGVILRGQQILVCQRSMNQFPPGVWEFPGGKVEPRESDESALVRELREELGVHVVVGGQIGVNEHTYGDTTVVLVAYVAVIEIGEPVAHEHAAMRWIGRESLSQLEWAPADIPLLGAVDALLEATAPY